MKNPRIEELELNLEAVESVMEDITNHMMTVDSLDVAGASKRSDKKGNQGRLCTITVECQQICSWF